MVGNEVAYFATVHFLMPVVSGVVYLVTLLRSKDCTFFLTTYHETYRYSL